MNPSSIEAKRQNILRMVRAIYDHPEISRKELAQQFGLSPSTVTLAVTALQEQNLVVESGQEEAAAGRRARLLRVNAAAGSILSVHLAGDLSVQLRLCDLCGTRLAEQTTPCPRPQPKKDDFPALLAGNIAAFLASAGAHPPLAAAAVIIPGVMHTDGTADLPVCGWESLDLRGLTEQLGVPVFCDTILHMLSGYEIQQQPPAQRQIYLSLEPGVGMNCHENGQAATSRNLLYGEIGHISMHEDGPLCYCGNRGCLEYYCGVTGILSRMAEAAAACPILASVPLTLEGLTQAAENGSRAAADLLGQAALELGRALVTIRNMLDPDQIIISGRLWQIAQVRQTALDLIRKRTISKRQPLPQILSATLPPDRYETGVCHYAFNRLVEELI